MNGMIVKELMEELSTMPPHAKVFIDFAEDGGYAISDPLEKVTQRGYDTDKAPEVHLS